MRVELEWYEMSMAADVGVRRHVESMRRGIRRADGTIPKWEEDIEGAAAELAFAKAFGLHWSGSVNTLDSPDVGEIGVRQATPSHHRLIIRDRDFPRYGYQAIFVLVTGERRVYDIRGWFRTGEARRDIYRKNPNGLGEAFFVPQAHLHPLSELRLGDGSTSADLSGVPQGGPRAT